MGVATEIDQSDPKVSSEDMRGPYSGIWYYKVLSDNNQDNALVLCDAGENPQIRRHVFCPDLGHGDFQTMRVFVVSNDRRAVVVAAKYYGGLQISSVDSVEALITPSFDQFPFLDRLLFLIQRETDPKRPSWSIFHQAIVGLRTIL